MLTPSDGRTDGQFLSYLRQEQRFRPYDPPLFDWLRMHVDAQCREVRRAVESELFMPSAHVDDIIPNDSFGRDAYFAKAKSAVTSCDLVFFDPDNGFEIGSCKRGNKNSCKYLFYQEAQQFFAAGHSILVYQHFPREERALYISRIGARLREVTDASVIAFRTPRVLFLLAMQPRHMVALERGARMVSERWDPAQLQQVHY